MTTADLDKVMEEKIRGTTRNPEYLYHYTSTSGFIGILKKRELWLSDINYLNDLEELHLAFRLAIQLLELADTKGAIYGAMRKFLVNQVRLAEISGTDSFYRYIDASPNLPFLPVFSFTAERDSLSQWRAYCRNGGYNIGFKFENIRKALKKSRYKPLFLKCVYQQDEQENILDTIIDYVSKKHDGKTDTDLRSASDEFFELLLRYGPFLKHNSFAHEEEWRIVLDTASVHQTDWKFRESNGVLIPYLTLAFENTKLFDSLRVCAGPCPFRQSAMMSAVRLLNSQELGFASVTATSSSFRDW